MKTITESGMIFGPYNDDEIFHIENSDTFSRIKTGVQIAEFLLLRRYPEKPDEILIVEAKSSSPKPANRDDFRAYIDDICAKLVNAFSLGWASFNKRHPSAIAELPEPFQNLDLATMKVHFILVINGHEKEWLPPVQDALRIALNSTVKTWALPSNSVAVLNEVLAAKHGLVTA